MSGRDVKPRLPRMPGSGRSRPSLVAAAQSQPEPEAASGPATTRIDLGSGVSSFAEGTAMDIDDVKPAVPAPTPAPAPIPVPGPSSAPLEQSRSATGSDTASGSGAATPLSADIPSTSTAAALPSASTSGSASASAAPKMKFKPKMPVRRAVQVQEDIKPDISSASVRGRPSLRARGRGGAARGGARAAASTIAAGPFGGSRSNSSRRVVAPPPPPRYQPDSTNVEVYSDNEDGTRTGVIDIEAVSALSESAPTSVYRERDLNGGKAKAKEAVKAKAKDVKRRRREMRSAREAAATAAAAAEGENGGARVKAEPVSPVRPSTILPDPNAGVPPPTTRVGDTMIAADEQQDRTADGRRMIRTDTTVSGTSGTTDSEAVNAAHAIDLSESESEEEDEDMEGDFVFADGMDNPEDKLFTFQFPSSMPKFVVPVPPAPPAKGDDDVAMDGAAAQQDLKPEVKPNLAHLRRKRSAPAPPPEGRIGTLVVMKSGKVKMVMGEGANAIVMNVAPGVPTTFLQQLVHLDAKAKSTTVLGEVHKQYTITPDLNRLLEELFLNGGETPGDRERKNTEADRRLGAERGLVKMEMSSP